MTAATASITPSMQAHASVLLERAATWAHGTRTRDGLAFFLFASSRTLADGTPIMNMTRADAQGCTCPGYTYRGICSHVEAVRQHNARQQPAPQPSTTWRPCERNCGELLAPEHIGRFCDHCSEKLRRILNGED